MLALTRDPPAGLTMLGALAAALVLAWQGAVRRGAARILAFGGSLLAAATALVVLAVSKQVLELVVLGTGAILTAAAVRVAFLPHGRAGGAWAPVAPPRRPVLLINPRSGGGKAERLAIADVARARGIKSVVLAPGGDLAALARQAVADGADALGMAGGDGSLAIVAAVCADHDLPFTCVPAGTRNHLALDLGVDRADPLGALDAFTDGVERRIDLAEVNGRFFVNNVSLGVYGRAVHRPSYRNAKLPTLLDTLPKVMGPSAPPPPVEVIDDLGRRREDAAVVVISNNPYALEHVFAAATRPRLDGGRLGVVVLGREVGQPRDSWRAWSTSTFEVVGQVPVRAGVDGEAAMLDPPLRFASRPAVLRVRISARHPGVSPSALLPRAPLATVSRLFQIAVGRTSPPPDEPALGERRY